MNVFQVPIILYPEERRNVAGGFQDGSCHIRVPRQLMWQKRVLVAMIDKVYWQILGKASLTGLERRTTEINQRHFGFEYRKVRFHRQFRRWGSCSSLKNINVTHRLIAGPEPLLDYILIHELAHLKHPNHHKDFCNRVNLGRVKQKSCRREQFEL